MSSAYLGYMSAYLSALLGVPFGGAIWRCESEGHTGISSQADAGHEGSRTITWLVTHLVPTERHFSVTKQPRPANARVRLVTKARPNKQAFGFDRMSLAAQCLRGSGPVPEQEPHPTKSPALPAWAQHSPASQARQGH
ncbi:hypothetical protein HaLaN_15866 [Haematococcus lacustris]|uniref:Uncharacterized protein n=1 Tax=Haematococcus lacustris TaxID=44745 RepID=A0A699ZSR5_HAELA|nr:hypothetical protein HaLaN_15866 [Haematococcus lacustris]